MLYILVAQLYNVIDATRRLCLGKFYLELTNEENGCQLHGIPVRHPIRDGFRVVGVESFQPPTTTTNNNTQI